MTTNSTIAAIRFGYGLSPEMPAPADAQALLAQLGGPDAITQTFPVAGSDEVWQKFAELADLRRQKRDNVPGAVEQTEQKFTEMRLLAFEGCRATLQRAAHSPDGFRERLVNFWANHFTVVAKDGGYMPAPTAFVEEAIRPNLTGTFAAMLKAAEVHPAMLLYLDQNTSIGPDSVAAKRRKGGLNENLAREILELHTLGVGANYTQTDVRQFAKLLTGLTFNAKAGFRFAPALAEPGAETVLGKTYGGETPPRIDAIYQALDDIAHRKETATHIAQKLAVHFVSDTPDPGLVGHVADAFLKTGGSLMAVYAALLEHPSSWAPLGLKVRQPFDFMASAVRALSVPVDALAGMEIRRFRNTMMAGLAQMGQPFQAAPGPNGWPEAAVAWISPQTLAARIQWSMALPAQLLPALPDPRDLVRTALGDGAGPDVIRAAAQAESRREGVGLVLASVEFNRR